MQSWVGGFAARPSGRDLQPTLSQPSSAQRRSGRLTVSSLYVLSAETRPDAKALRQRRGLLEHNLSTSTLPPLKSPLVAYAALLLSCRTRWASRRSKDGAQTACVSRQVVDAGIESPEYFAREGVVYVPNLFVQAEFDAIQREFHGLRDRLGDEGPSFAHRRLCARVPEGGMGARCLRSADVMARLRESTGLAEPLTAAVSFPAEYREYGEGAWMEWHADVALTTPPQLEMIYTIGNTSDSQTQWASSLTDVVRGNVTSIRTEPNSALLFVAEGAVHSVTAPSVGSRAIIKAVYFVGENQVPTEHWSANLAMVEGLS